MLVCEDVAVRKEGVGNGVKACRRALLDDAFVDCIIGLDLRELSTLPTWAVSRLYPGCNAFG